jgi:hypothetical protein
MLALLVAAGFLLFGGSSALPDAQFAFSSDAWGDYDLFIQTTEGEYIAMLTFSTGSDIEPSFTHDGNYLFYSANTWDNLYFDINRMVPPWEYNPDVQPSFDLEMIHQTVNLTFPASDDFGPDVLYHCARDLCTDWVAFHSNLDGDYDLYADGPHRQRHAPVDQRPRRRGLSKLVAGRDAGGLHVQHRRSPRDIHVLNLRSGETRYTDSIWIEDPGLPGHPMADDCLCQPIRPGIASWLMDADCTPTCARTSACCSSGPV